MNRSKVNSESGSILVEASIVAPVLFLFMFFGLDLFIYSQNKTVVTQVTREAALYLATVPGTLIPSTGLNPNVFTNILSDDAQEVADWTSACEADFNFDDCPHLNTHIRVQRMLKSSRAFMDIENSSTTSVYDGDFVTVTVSVPIETFLSMFSSSTGSVVTVRRVST